MRGVGIKTWRLLFAASFAGCAPSLESSCQTAADCPPERPTCAAGVCILVADAEIAVDASTDVTPTSALDASTDATPMVAPDVSTDTRMVDARMTVDVRLADARGVIDGALPADGALLADGALPVEDAQLVDVSRPPEPDVVGCMPQPEACNGADDDCDALIDEGLERPCGLAIGECRPGVERCADAAWQPCLPVVEPADEACDARDNDCDGLTDEGLSQPCGVEMGECHVGLARCFDGQFVSCDAAPPQDEHCDNLDNDCDGTVDEGITRDCGSSVGECSPGYQICTEGEFGPCSEDSGPLEEVCDLRDNDCDGNADEQLVCVFECGAPRLPCCMNNLCVRGAICVNGTCQ